MRCGCTFTSRESPRSKAPSSSRPSSAGDHSTVRSQLRPRMSTSSLILNHRAKEHVPEFMSELHQGYALTAMSSPIEKGERFSESSQLPARSSRPNMARDRACQSSDWRCGSYDAHVPFAHLRHHDGGQRLSQG